MTYSFICCWILLLNVAVMVISESYYSVIAPGVIKSNHKYNVIVSLHEAREPAAIKVSIEGPSFQQNQVVLLQPYETVSVEFHATKLQQGEYKLIAEGISGIKFRNESRLSANILAGSKIYIQTDKAIYKPGDVVQFRVLFMDEHTRPLKLKEPIRIEIMGSEFKLKILYSFVDH